MKKHSILASSVALTLLLTACGEDSEQVDESVETTQEDSSTTEEENIDTAEEEPSTAAQDFDAEVVNEGEPIDGGVARVGFVTDTAWTGIFDRQHFLTATDAKLMDMFLGNLLLMDENYQFVGGEEWGTPANIEFDEDNDRVTITIRDGVKWHDGEDMTADDIVFAHEIIGDPNYTGVRYGDAFTNIEGMEEYKAGEADSISGLTLSDDEMSVTIQYKEFNPSMFQYMGGIWDQAAPRHYLGDIPVEELESHERVREKPIGFGPFKVENVVPGESLELSAFEDFYEGRLHLDGLIIERVPTSTAVEALRAGEFDWVDTMPTAQFDSFKDGIPGYTTIGFPKQSYEYFGFKMGEWNSEENKVEYDPNAKMSNQNLRQAMGHAIDIESISEEFYLGLITHATSHIVSNFPDFHNDELKGYYYDPNLANELLDEAGYIDVDDDGFREDPDGEPLEITFASMGSEVTANYYIQSWQDVGLNVSLLDGRIQESNAFYDRLEADDPEIDVYEAGWVVGADPTPNGIYGPNSLQNYTRFESEENTRLLEEIISDEAFDLEYRSQAFHDWQEYFIEEAPTIPTYWRTEIQMVNDRVSAYEHIYKPGKDHTTSGLHSIYLTAEEPITE